MLASLGLALLLLAWADVVEPRRWGLVAVALCFAGATIEWVDEIVELGVVPRLATQAASDQNAFLLLQLQDHAYRVVFLELPVKELPYYWRRHAVKPNRLKPPF
jgi:hypothetical protein